MTMLNEQSEETDFAERLALRQAVSHLPDDHRTTLLMHYVGGWSLQEVADLLQIPINTVRSRMMTAKSRLRDDLRPLFTQPVPKKGRTMTSNPLKNYALSADHTDLLHRSFPDARIVSVQENPEPWMPFAPRVVLALKNGTEKTVDFRSDLTPESIDLFRVLESRNIPCPQPITAPQAVQNGYVTLCEAARGENLLLWTLGGTPHRVRLATERAFEGIDRLQAATDALLNDPVGAKLPRRSLNDEITTITDAQEWSANRWLSSGGGDARNWLSDRWFADALKKAQTTIAGVETPLAYTNYLHFFPNFYRIAPGAAEFDEPLGWPGDTAYAENPLCEFVCPQGHLGDPLFGLAMVWVMDCYPFVHTGFVEQFLWRRSVSKRDFAPRLLICALQTIARDLPRKRSSEGSDYWDALHGWANQALEWL